LQNDFPEQVAWYDRLSGEGQKDNNSLQTQQAQQQEYCALHGYTVEDNHVYIEIHTGVDSWRERKVLQQLLAAARRKEFTVLVVYHTDRLARGDDLIILWHELMYYDVRIESVSQNLENTTEGKIMLHILSITSKFEHDRLMQRTQDNKRTSVQNGNLMGGIPLYGYRYENETRRSREKRDSRNRYIVDPDKGKVVAQMFAWSDEGYSIWKITELLHEQGILSPNGNEWWQTSTVSRLLRNPYYTGRAAVYKQKIDKSNGKKRFVDREPEELIFLPEGVVPRIVEDDVFERVQEQLKDNKKYAMRNSSHAELSLLRCGYAICAYCKGNLSAVYSSSLQRSMYKCDAKVNHKRCEVVWITCALIDEPAWKKAQEIIRDPKKLRESIAAIQEDDEKEKEYQPVSIENRLTEIEAEINSLVDLKRAAKSEAAHARIKYNLGELEQEQKKLLSEKRKIDTMKGKWELAQAEIEKFEAWCAEFRDRLETATYAEKRRAIERLGIKVHVYKYGTRPRYKIDVRPPKLLEVVLQISTDRPS
jgi:site-specific DNA recombinase